MKTLKGSMKPVEEIIIQGDFAVMSGCMTAHDDSDSFETSETGVQLQVEVRAQNYFCCLYDNLPWIGLVDEISTEFGDFHVNFVHPHGPAKQFYWPQPSDSCWLREEDIICVLETPSLCLSSSRGRYSISRNDVRNISKMCDKWPFEN